MKFKESSTENIHTDVRVQRVIQENKRTVIIAMKIFKITFVNAGGKQQEN